MPFRDIREWIAGRDYNFYSSIFLIIFSGGVATEAYRLDLGSLRSPGPGFFFFGASCILGFLALHLFLKSSLAREHKGREYVWKGKHWVKTISVLGVLLIYIFLLNVVGYLLITFFCLVLLCSILKEGEGKRKWISILGISSLTSFVTYVVFSRWFSLQFPKGLIGFF